MEVLTLVIIVTHQIVILKLADADVIIKKNETSNKRRNTPNESPRNFKFSFWSCCVCDISGNFSICKLVKNEIMKNKKWTNEELFIEFWAWVIVIAFGIFVIKMWN